ncbi:hydroxyacylglutathione hydrolase [Aureimonas fodinaquatilis]|uniref:Hydroxyacylglutathione hydrolase n=1 Tax=Aureimonas fodinaquatilis TaxID=2565783 RepID=A0A5B0E0F3_9HYPH|nr:hydroxyacylglutathione hydrolase [Aureimonas fodinaquatilis]KAA0971595.1 hydroxyacylglutathione hydrolase [Aureimonas fodinaquatilis]
MSTVEIRQFICRTDNFGVLLRDVDNQLTIAIDAPEEQPILDALAAEGWKLTHILTTHHHNDHVAANDALKRRFNVQIIGPDAEADRIPGIDRGVRGGDRFAIGVLDIEVIDTPGHTLGSVSYYMPGLAAVFAGDALFSLGCGRLLEGTPAMLWQSLQKLRALPDETMLYCGHEYTASNARFAASINPHNLALHERVTEVERLRVAGEPTLPVPLGLEKRTNPFLRADDADLAEALGQGGQSAEAVFADMRSRKDRF